MLYNNIPQALRAMPNWAITMPAANGKLKRPANATGAASPTDPSTWMTFDEAVRLSKARNVPIGFMLTAEANVTLVDIDTGYAREDIAQQLDPEYAAIRLDFHERLIRWLNRDTPTYTERSVSGYNHHVLVRGNIGNGIRLQSITTTHNGAQYAIHDAGIELYSQARFVVLTGDVVTQCNTIAEVDLTQLLQQCNNRVSTVQLEELPAVDSDDAVRELLLSSDYNLALWSHAPMTLKWQSYDHPLRATYASQSEADMALILNIARLTPSNDQVRRLFKQSGLGQRSKATMGYIDRTLASARAVLINEATQLQQIDDMVANLQQFYGAAEVLDDLPKSTHVGNTTTDNNLSTLTTPLPTVSSTAVGLLAAVAPREEEVADVSPIDITDLIGNQSLVDIGIEGFLPYPPGLAGVYAAWIKGYSAQPMTEAAITHVLATLAGIGGNSFKVNPNHPTGINSYFILMSLSATGKDILHTGVGVIKEYLQDVCNISPYIVTAKYVSEAALMQEIGTHETDSFVHMFPEFSKLIHSSLNGNTNAEAILGMMLPAYTWSTKGNVVGAIKRSGHSASKADSSIEERRHGFGYSMVGECTETDLNNALNGAMLRDGRLSRFICIQGNNMLIPSQIKRTPMPAQLKANLAACVNKATEIYETGHGGYTQIVDSDEAHRLLEAYHQLMIRKLNNHAADDAVQESIRVVYNRARLKAWRVAGSLAMLENPTYPVISGAMAIWAIALINRDIRNMLDKINQRIIGDSADDSDRVERLMMLMREWVGKNAYGNKETNRIFGKGLKHGIVALRAIRENVRGLVLFKDPKTQRYDQRLLDNAIRVLIIEGFITEITEADLTKHYPSLTGFRGKFYQLRG